MPSTRDWLGMVRETARSVGSEDVSDLFRRDWKSAKAKLMAEAGPARPARGRLRAVVREINAILYGLSRRLSPPRRVLLGFAFVCILLDVIGSWDFQVARNRWSVHFDVGGGLLVMAIAALLVLLAMELVDKIGFRDELQLARELQATLLPRSVPQVPGWRVGAYNRIANMVGGDLYEFALLPDGRLAILFGDAAGHGMTAGLVMAVAHAAFRTQLEVNPEPAALVPALNRILCRTGGARSFFSCLYLVLSPDGAFSATFAGHPPVWILGADGALRQAVGTGAYPLGIKDEVAWPPQIGRAAAGERLVLCSDGVNEAANDAGEQFGEGRALSVLASARSAPAQGAAEALAREVASFCGRQAPEDDISIVVVDRAGA